MFTTGCGVKSKALDLVATWGTAFGPGELGRRSSAGARKIFVKRRVYGSQVCDPVVLVQFCVSARLSSHLRFCFGSKATKDVALLIAYRSIRGIFEGGMQFQPSWAAAASSTCKEGRPLTFRQGAKRFPGVV